MVDMLEDPEFVESCWTGLPHSIGHSDEVLQYDIDGVMFGDDWGAAKGSIVRQAVVVPLHQTEGRGA